MSEFQKFNATTHPIVRLEDDWNNLLHHGLERLPDFLVRQNGSYYEAIQGGGVTGAGTIAYGGATNAGAVDGTNAADVSQAALDGLPAGRLRCGKVAWKGEFKGIDSTIQSFDDYTILDLTQGLFQPETDFNKYLFLLKGNKTILHGGLIDAYGDHQVATEPVIAIDGGLTDITVADVNIYNLEDIGIWVSGGPTSRVQNLRFLSNTLTQNAGSNTDLLVPIAEGGVASGNIIYAKTGFALNVYECIGFVCSHNFIKVDEAAGTAIAVSSSLNTIVSDNVIEATTDFRGIRVAPETEFGGGATPQVGAKLVDNYICGPDNTHGIAIILADCSYVHAIGNTFQTLAWGVESNAGTIDNIHIEHNHFIDVGTGRVDTVAPTNSVFRYNTGYATENSGEATGTGIQQGIAHGLDVTPADHNVVLTEIDTGGLPYISAAPDAGSIYVTAGGGKKFRWEVHMSP